MRTYSKGFDIMIWIFIGSVLIAVLCLWQNNSIVVSNSDYYNAKVPAAFNNFKIVQISDLHNKMFGEDQSKLLGKVEGLSPDIIVITGDLIDRRRFDLDAAMIFIEGAIEIAPTYYVSGNHEAWSGKWQEIADQLTGAGVYMVDDSAIELSKGGSTIQILGLSDPAFLIKEFEVGAKTSEMAERLNQWSSIREFKILLTHRPELFDLYSENHMDLIFAGHAHGGQFRIPFIGGVFSPNQGFFPEYTSGRHSMDLSTMYVSRGLGNSLIPIRINNRPEIVAVTLKNAD